MADSRLRATVNPWGTLYNPASIAEALDTLSDSHGEETNPTPRSLGEGWCGGYPNILIITLGTTHIFMRDGKIVANCQKLPARLFTERDMETDEIVTCMYDAISRLHDTSLPFLSEERGGDSSDLKVILTVSPYRYANWGHNSVEAAGHKGMHGNQLSKARLLLAVDRLTHMLPYSTYFPAYEIVLDELRDYRFYDPDMLHPSQQAVDYIWERFQETMLSKPCMQFIKEMEPIRRAYAHRPQNPDSDDYRRFIEDTKRKEKEIWRLFE